MSQPIQRIGIAPKERRAGPALRAAFVWVLGVGTPPTSEQWDRFNSLCDSASQPFLRHILDSVDDQEAVVAEVVQTPDVAHGLLSLAAEVFDRDPEGSPARVEFVQILRQATQAEAGPARVKQRLEAAESLVYGDPIHPPRVPLSRFTRRLILRATIGSLCFGMFLIWTFVCNR